MMSTTGHPLGICENEKLFIVGCPRTGSTLMRQLLNKSEKVCIIPETHFVHRWSKEGSKKHFERFGDLTKDETIERMLDFVYSPQSSSEGSYWRWLRNNVDRELVKQRLLETDRSERAIFDLLLRIFVQKKIGALRSDLILGEKTPIHLYYVTILFDWFPKVKIIHTFRDPRGIFVSSEKLIRKGEWGFREKLTALPGRMIGPALEVVTVSYIMKYWLDAVRLHATYQQMYPENYLMVKFEDMVNEPEPQVQKVCHFLNIPFEQKIMEEVAIAGSSFQAQNRVFSGFDPQAAERWKEHIHPMARACFTLLGGAHLKRFGYAP